MTSEPTEPMDSAEPAEPTEPAASASKPPEPSPAAVGARLAELFPALFGPGTPKPIKLRIQTDIQTRAPGEFTRKSLSVFLHRHTTSTAYLRALVASPQRFDLDGAPAGELAVEHRDAATTELERRRAIVEARRAAERDAQRAANAARRREAAALPAHGPQPDVAAPEGSAPVAPGEGRPQGVRPRRDAGRPGAGRAAGDARPGRPERPPRPDRPPRRDGPARPERADRPPRQGGPELPGRPPAAPREALPEDEGQRQRALLLRAWEDSPLTKANFCVLKRISEADLDAQLAQALAERKARR